tara:strand:+ start:159 stop:392 length:234 start_codon:yes stop_codon:yes gene_type:complete
MSRFDFNKQTRDAFNKAVALNIIDAVDLGCMFVEFGADARAIMNEITECAWAQRHDGTTHADWCKINDAWHAARRAA